MATAKHRATDLIRRRKTLERKYEELGRDVERDQGGRDVDTAIDEALEWLKRAPYDGGTFEIREVVEYEGM